MLTIATKDGQSCTRVDVVDVQQQGVKSLNDIANDQVIIQMRNTSCVGRITGFVVSLSQEQSGSDYPSIQVWGPTKKSSPELFKNINYYELTEQDINKTGNYYFANVLLEEAFIFGQGSFIGYYQPPSPRYSIWSVNATGYNFYTFKGNNTRSLNLTRASDLLTVVKDSQPLIQIFFGKDISIM